LLETYCSIPEAILSQGQVWLDSRELEVFISKGRVKCLLIVQSHSCAFNQDCLSDTNKCCWLWLIDCVYGNNNCYDFMYLHAVGNVNHTQSVKVLSLAVSESFIVPNLESNGGRLHI